MSRDLFPWISVAGLAVMVTAAFVFDWRVGLFVVGLVLWWDFR